jgi:hypothetical protein
MNKNLDRARVARVLSGLAGDEDLEALGRENVLAIKSDTGERHYRSVAHDHKALVQERRGFEFVVSDEGRDRMGDRILVKGWDLTEFKRNPIMLWAHDDWSGESVLGTWDTPRKEPPNLVAEGEFTPTGVNPFADMIFEMVDRKIVRASSVGFMPQKTTRGENPEEREEMDLGDWGVLFEKALLLEISIVPIPANPRALRKSMAEACEAAGCDLKDEKLERFLAACPEDETALCRRALGRQSRSVFAMPMTMTSGYMDTPVTTTANAPSFTVTAIEAAPCGCGSKSAPPITPGDFDALRLELLSAFEETEEAVAEIKAAIGTLSKELKAQLAERRGAPAASPQKSRDASAAVPVTANASAKSGDPPRSEPTEPKDFWARVLAKMPAPGQG